MLLFLYLLGYTWHFGDISGEARFFVLFIYFYCSNFHKRQIGVKLIIVINFGDVIMRLAMIIYGFVCIHCALFYC